VLEFQEKRKVKRLIYSRLTLVILLIILVLMLRSVWGVYEKAQLTKENLNKTTNDLAGLKEREQILSAEIEQLKTNSGVEKEIREKYGLVKPGEEVIVIVNKNDDLISDSDLDDLSFWQKILKWLQ
jgi:cell division protein FtsB